MLDQEEAYSSFGIKREQVDDIRVYILCGDQRGQRGCVTTGLGLQIDLV